MKRLFIAIAFTISAATTIAEPALAADVGVSIGIGHPGFYGPLDVRSITRPPVLYSRPVVIDRSRRNAVIEPVYLRVPSGHAKNWRKHCKKYDACGRPVYFVRDDWYTNVYVPQYREQHRVERRDERSDDHHDRGDNHDRERH